MHKLFTMVLLGGLLMAQDPNRFDMSVRNDFFAGFAGNRQALDRGMKACEEALSKNSNNAAAMVWHGAGNFYLGGAAFQAGDMATGQQLSEKGLGEMEHAVAIAPDNLGVRIPRGAVLLTASQDMPAQMARPLIDKGLADFEHSYELQAKIFDTLGTHPRGELLIGMASAYARTGKTEQADAMFERIRATLPGTPYASSAQKWLDTKTLAPREAGCLGCHVAK